MLSCGQARLEIVKILIAHGNCITGELLEEANKIEQYMTGNRMPNMPETVRHVKELSPERLKKLGR